MRERLWVALDVETLKEADGLLERLAGAGQTEKMGARSARSCSRPPGPPPSRPRSSAGSPCSSI